MNVGMCIRCFPWGWLPLGPAQLLQTFLCALIASLEHQNEISQWAVRNPTCRVRKETGFADSFSDRGN